MKTAPEPPKFKNRPSENSEFSPAVSKYLHENNLACVTVDGVFDLLVTKTNKSSNKYLELKVSLKNGAYPASRLQWEFFQSMPINVSSCYRLFIYDHAAKKYCLASLNDVRPALRTEKPSDTWYLKRKHLKTLQWKDPVDAYQALVAWVNGL